MSVDKIEALVDAIASLKGWHNPDSDSYQWRNPLLVQSFSRPGKNLISGDGTRVFSSSLAGMRACVFDADLKIRGESRAGIKKTDLLENILRAYGITELGGQQTVVKFLKRALKDDTITKTQPLSWFLQGESK